MSDDVDLKVLVQGRGGGQVPLTHRLIGGEALRAGPLTPCLADDVGDTTLSERIVDRLTDA